MSIYGLGTLDLDASVSDLPGNIFREIRILLDTNPADKDWRALARIAEDDYNLRPAFVESCSPAITNGSAAEKLLFELSSQGMTIRALKTYLDKIHIDTFPLGLSQYEEVEILCQPAEIEEKYEGDSLILEVEASGHPYPRYQWFFCKNGKENFVQLQGRIENKLVINNLTGDNAGTYCCRVHNSGNDKKPTAKFTEKTLVSVAPNPHPLPNGLNPLHDEEEVIYRFRRLCAGQQEEILDGFVNGLDPRACGVVGHGLIVGHPLDVEVGVNEPFVLNVQTNGNPPITYQWYRNNIKLTGQVYSKITVKHAMAADFGRYFCVVSNGFTSEQSNLANVKRKLPVASKSIDIVIVSHPRSVSVKQGGCAMFSCEAKCSVPLKYQWYRDGRPLEGETDSEIKFRNIQDRCPEGMYMCMITADSAESQPVFTTQAFLKVEVATEIDNIAYNPSDKVALLIGNSDYKCEAQLNASTKDVRDLKDAFTTLDFKVVSLLNLTKPEIENAVTSFCDLIDKNIYAVFYFCGHGFEEHGLSYLVPTDAPHGYSAQHCVSAEMVLENMQRKNPKLILMIMDICRQSGKVKSQGSPGNVKMTAKGNTVFCYATSTGLAAYENKHGGLLVNHLSPLLVKPIGIDSLISQMKEEFHRNRKHSDIQIPELRSNLLEPRRSLADKISLKGQTEMYQRRTSHWQSLHEKPPKRNVSFPEVHVLVELDFQAEFSNILSVFVTVLEPGITQRCVGKITNFSPPVSALGDIAEFRRDNRAATKVTLQDIQKLKEDLIVDVTITFYVDNKHYFLMQRLNLGQPLVAKLQLWQPRDDFTPSVREAIEQAEDSSLT